MFYYYRRCADGGATVRPAGALPEDRGRGLRTIGVGGLNLRKERRKKRTTPEALEMKKKKKNGDRGGRLFC